MGSEGSTSSPPTKRTTMHFLQSPNKLYLYLHHFQLPKELLLSFPVTRYEEVVALQV